VQASFPKTLEKIREKDCNEPKYSSSILKQKTTVKKSRLYPGLLRETGVLEKLDRPARVGKNPENLSRKVHRTIPDWDRIKRIRNKKKGSSQLWDKRRGKREGGADGQETIRWSPKKMQGGGRRAGRR